MREVGQPPDRWRRALRSSDWSKKARQYIGRSVLICFTVLLTSCLPAFFGRPPEPVIDFIEGGLFGVAPFSVTFDISQSSDPDGEIAAFVLEFGDGTPPAEGSNLAEPIEHTYESPGTYVVRLTVTDDHGMNTSAFAAITVVEEESPEA